MISLTFQTKGEHQTSLTFLWASAPRKTPAVRHCTQTMFSACCIESRVTSQPGRNTCSITLCTQKHLQYCTMHTETPAVLHYAHRNTCNITLCTQKHLQYYTMHTHTMFSACCIESTVHSLNFILFSSPFPDHKDQLIRLVSNINFDDASG